MVQKTTKVYANHGMPLECDIYTNDDYAKDTPVFLYFHPGGLVDWGRDCIAPWLVQVCLRQKWPLISPSYRLLPQTGAKGLLEDVSAAYDFAQRWDALADGRRRVIVGGASGGFFTAALVSHHCYPPPLALFSIEGISTFRHPFFNSSILLTPEPIPDSAVADIIARPIEVGVTPPGATSAFRVDQLLLDGSKNSAYKPPPPPATPQDPSKPHRGMLYDYYTYKNGWLDLVGDIDPGYEWARDLAAKERLDKWPLTVIFHGDADSDVAIDVSEQMREQLGRDKVQ